MADRSPNCHPGTIGHAEELAGILPDHDSRFKFWVQFKDAPDPIAAGVAELDRLASPPPKTPKPKRKHTETVQP